MKKNRTLRALAAWSASLALLGGTALAETEPTEANNPKSGGSISTGFAFSPVYAGSDEQRSRGGAILSYQWANGLSVGARGIGWQLSQQPDLQYGVGLGVSAGRKEGDSIYLRGMGDIKDQPVFGAYLNASIAKGLWLSSSVELGSGNAREGNLLKLGASYALPITAALELSLGASAAFANADHMASYFGVSAAQSATSSYATYTPSAGLRNIDLDVGLTYKITPKWAMGLGVSATGLSKAAKDSPLVRKPNYLTALVGLVYTF
jgi:outer membrane scaffolding protein for murein synthesis (MipA/OmpV family)